MLSLPVSFKCFVPFGVTDGSEWLCYDDLLHGFGYGQKLPQVLDADIVAVTDFFLQLFDQTHERVVLPTKGILTTAGGQVWSLI